MGTLCFRARGFVPCREAKCPHLLPPNFLFSSSCSTARNWFPSRSIPTTKSPAAFSATSGKTEAWVVLDVGPEGRIYAGFQEGVGRDDVLRHFRAGTLDQCLHSFQPRPGDCIFLRAGTVHAVGGGVILAEVQQTSDATFRLYDWNRLGSDGKPRALHIEQALESLDFSLGPVAPVAKQRASGFNPEARCCAKNQAETLVRCDYFRLDRFHLNAPLPLPYADRFSIWIVAAGSAELRGRNYRRSFQAGETVLVPACTRELSWEPDGNASGTAAQLLAILG